MHEIESVAFTFDYFEYLAFFLKLNEEKRNTKNLIT